jgi:hypothetical protein
MTVLAPISSGLLVWATRPASDARAATTTPEPSATSGPIDACSSTVALAPTVLVPSTVASTSTHAPFAAYSSWHPSPLASEASTTEPAAIHTKNCTAPCILPNCLSGATLSEEYRSWKNHCRNCEVARTIPHTVATIRNLSPLPSGRTKTPMSVSLWYPRASLSL